MNKIVTNGKLETGGMYGNIKCQVNNNIYKILQLGTIVGVGKFTSAELGMIKLEKTIK